MPKRRKHPTIQHTRAEKRKLIRRKKIEAYNTIITNIERKSNTNKFFKEIKNTKKGFMPRISILKKKNNYLITETTEIPQTLIFQAVFYILTIN